MKIFTLLIFFPIFAFSQGDTTQVNYPLKDGKVVYESIIELPGLTKANLYSASKKWIADSFKSAKSVIQSEDIASGQIIGKGYNELSIFKNEGAILGRAFNTECTFQIDVKDEKCRIRFYDIIWVYGSGTYTFKTPINDLVQAEVIAKQKGKKTSTKKGDENKTQLNNQYNRLIESYKNSLKNTAKDDF